MFLVLIFVYIITLQPLWIGGFQEKTKQAEGKNTLSHVWMAKEVEFVSHVITTSRATKGIKRSVVCFKCMSGWFEFPMVFIGVVRVPHGVVLTPKEFSWNAILVFSKAWKIGGGFALGSPKGNQSHNGLF